MSGPATCSTPAPFDRRNHPRPPKPIQRDSRAYAEVCLARGKHSHPNLAQYLILTEVNQLWVADMTYLRLEGEFVYLAVVLDAFSYAAQSFRNTVELAQHAERLRYRRYWLAEHHNMPGIASAATAVLIARVAAATSTIRVGAGGIMLPNHAPLVIAEQFGTLESIFPGRIDLGLGRAPGTDRATTRALRRNL